MKISLILFCILMMTFSAAAQWVKTNGPEGGFTGIIYNDASSGYIFAGGNGFYRSANNGATWSEANAGMAGDVSPVAIARAGSKLYAASLDRFYVSTNNGDTWTLSGANIPAQALSMIAVGSTIVVGVNVYGVYRTTDDGSSWTAGTGFQPSNNIAQTFAFQNGKLLCGLGGKRIWLSNDTGKTWAQYGNGTLFGASHTVGSLVVHNSKVYAACSDSGVFVSTDGGANWTHSSSGMNPRAEVSKVASNGTDLYALVLGAYTGVDTGLVYRSTNNGASWVSVKSDLNWTSGNSLGFGTGKVFYASGAGIYASTNNGGHWVWSNAGLRNVNSQVLLAHGTTLFVPNGGGVAKTVDGGATWTIANIGLPKNSGVGGMTSHGTYVFGTVGDGITGVVRSSDDGSSWVTMNNGLTGFGLYSGLMASSPGTVYLGTFGGIYASSNDGGNWTGPGTGLPFGSPSAIYVNGSDVWAAMGSYGAYLSTDNGSTWSPRNTGLPDFSKDVTTITSNGANLFVGGGSAIYISTNNGGNWTLSSTGIPPTTYLNCLFSVNGEVFAGAGGDPSVSAIYRSTNNGANWAPDDAGLPIPSTITAIAVVGSEIYGIYTGVWKRPLSSASTTDITVQPSWNMLSVPRSVSDYGKSALFPSASSGAFAYGPSGYVAADTLQSGIGYWVKFSSGQTVSVSGQATTADTISVNAGWNLIGSITSPVPVTNISSVPGGIVTSSFFGYGLSYAAADTINPGYAYWVKVNQNGQLVLSSSAANPSIRIRIVPAQELPPSPQKDLQR